MFSVWCSVERGFLEQDLIHIDLLFQMMIGLSHKDETLGTELQ